MEKDPNPAFAPLNSHPVALTQEHTNTLHGVASGHDGDEGFGAEMMDVDNEVSTFQFDEKGEIRDKKRSRNGWGG
jgi:hypothetical protein